MESGLQQDQPPAIGNISSLVVVIKQNDNVEGVLEFMENYVNVTGKSQNHLKVFTSVRGSKRLSAVCKISFSRGGCGLCVDPSGEESGLIWTGLSSVHFSRPECDP